MSVFSVPGCSAMYQSRANIFQLISPFGAPVTRISKDECFFTVQKLVGLIEVVFVCAVVVKLCVMPVRASTRCEPSSRSAIDSFFSLLHLGIAFARFVLGGVGSFDDGGIDQ